MKSSLFDNRSIAGKTVCTPCFGPSGKGYFRLSVFGHRVFGHRENVIEAVERIKKNLK